MTSPQDKLLKKRKKNGAEISKRALKNKIKIHEQNQNTDISKGRFKIKMCFIFN